MKRLALVLIVSMIALIFPSLALAQSTAFTYQGYLELGGVPVSNTCDFEFRLFDSESAGTQIGSTNPVSGVPVADGLFTVTLDFSASPFINGEPRYLDIAVRCPPEVSLTTLSPRTPLLATPYSVRSMYAGQADSAPWAGLTGVPAGFADGIDNGFNYVRIVIVSPIPGDATASGTVLRNALAGITDASASNPYLLFIEPGVYDIGTTGLQLKSFVDVQGSGENVTFIQGSVPGITEGLIYGADNTHVRYLTIRQGSEPTLVQSYVYVRINTGTTTLEHVRIAANYSTSNYYSPKGVSLVGTGRVVLHEVNFDLEGVSLGSSPIAVFMNGASTSAIITDSIFSVSNSESGAIAYGIYTSGGSARVSNSTVAVSDVNSQPSLFSTGGGLIEAERSRLDGRISVSGGGILRIAHSRINGSVSTVGTVTLRCFNNYNPDFTPYTGC